MARHYCTASPCPLCHPTHRPASVDELYGMCKDNPVSTPAQQDAARIAALRDIVEAHDQHIVNNTSALRLFNAITRAEEVLRGH